MARLGFVGTGTMGAPIAVHLAKADHDLRVFDRFPDATKTVVDAGARLVASAADAAEGAACVFLSLPAPADVEAAMTGPGGVLSADPRPAVVVDLSTNSTGMVGRLHERCAALGVGFVDAPVSGGRAKAQTGELSVLVGASETDFAAVESLLQTFAAEVFHVGVSGTGTVAKLVNNQLFLAASELVQEAYVLGAAAGLEPSVLHRIIKASSAGPYAALAPLLLGRKFDDVIFRLDIAAKDLTLAVDTAREYGVEVPATAGALSVYQDALDAGMGTEVFHATLKQLEKSPGIELPALTRGREAVVSAVEVAPVDLSDDESFRGGFPHEFFTWLRDTHPVFWHEPTARTPDGEGFWVVSRHADVNAVQRDPVTFSSDRAGIREKGGTAIKDERTAGTMLNQTDDPQHQRLRTLVSRGFTPRAVAELRDELRRRATLMLDDAGTEPFDFVHGFARELPSQAVCIVLGVPAEDQPQLLDWLDAGIEADSPSILSADAMRKIRTYAIDLIAFKRANPDPGIMSTIVHARSDEDGTGLSDPELIAFFALLFPAGAETTRSAIAGAVKAFIDYPDQFQRLQADPGLMATAIEEVVRWTTPSIYKRRTAARDVDLAGVRIGAGDKVTFWEMSANRDERMFTEPFRFDIGRSPNPHLGFGWGAHFCLGASLARLEIRVALELLVERYAGFEFTGDTAWMPNNRLLGLKTLPVRMIPR